MTYCFGIDLENNKIISINYSKLQNTLDKCDAKT